MFKLGQKVEFRYGSGDSALGTIISYNEETEKVIVEDEEGEHWKGLADWIIEVVDDES